MTKAMHEPVGLFHMGAIDSVGTTYAKSIWSSSKVAGTKQLGSGMLHACTLEKVYLIENKSPNGNQHHDNLS